MLFVLFQLDSLWSAQLTAVLLRGSKCEQDDDDAAAAVADKPRQADGRRLTGLYSFFPGRDEWSSSLSSSLTSFSPSQSTSSIKMWNKAKTGFEEMSPENNFRFDLAPKKNVFRDNEKLMK